MGGWVVRGLDGVFGFAGAGLALLGCLAGHVLAAAVAAGRDLPFLDVLSRLRLGVAIEAMFGPMDLLSCGPEPAYLITGAEFEIRR